MKTYTSYDQLPIMLSVTEVAKFLSISRTNAYELIHTEGFHRIHLDKRIVIPKDKLLEWRNNWMLRQTEYVVTYIAHSWGGAYRCAEKARRQKKVVINLKNLLTLT